MILEVKNDMMTGKGTENALHLELIKKGKEIERLNNIIEEKTYLYNKLSTESEYAINKLNNIINDLKQKNNLAENILYDYLYNDDKITKEKYEQFKGLKEGKNNA